MKQKPPSKSSGQLFQEELNALYGIKEAKEVPPEATQEKPNRDKKK
jgi:hypothetical protein